MDAHAEVGEGLLALLLFRVAWGFVGSDTARFGRFVRSPHEALRHLARLFRREPDAQVGHNRRRRLDGRCCCWCCCSVQTLTGIIVNNDVAERRSADRTLAGLAC